MKTRFCRYLALTLLAALSATGQAVQTAMAADGKGTVVLVHGAFADGSSWSKVIPYIKAKGYDVIAVQLPLTSLSDDAATTSRAIERAEGPVTLVGHSWGGSVITQAGNVDKVEALVYVAAFANEPNTNFHDLADKYPAPGLAEVTADSHGFARLTKKGISTFFAPEASDDEKALLAATQNPIRAANFGEKVTVAAWQSKPNWFVVTEEDQMIVPALQAAMATAIKAKVTRVQSGHVPMLSKPEVVAETIIEAADQATNLNSSK